MLPTPKYPQPFFGFGNGLRQRPVRAPGSQRQHRARKRVSIEIVAHIVSGWGLRLPKASACRVTRSAGAGEKISRPGRRWGTLRRRGLRRPGVRRTRGLRNPRMRLRRPTASVCRVLRPAGTNEEIQRRRGSGNRIGSGDHMRCGSCIGCGGGFGGCGGDTRRCRHPRGLWGAVNAAAMGCGRWCTRWRRSSAACADVSAPALRSEALTPASQ